MVRPRASAETTNRGMRPILTRTIHQPQPQALMSLSQTYIPTNPQNGHEPIYSQEGLGDTSLMEQPGPYISTNSSLTAAQHASHILSRYADFTSDSLPNQGSGIMRKPQNMMSNGNQNVQTNGFKPVYSTDLSQYMHNTGDADSMNGGAGQDVTTDRGAINRLTTAPHPMTHPNILSQQIGWLKQDGNTVKHAVYELERDRDSLRHAVRKLKVENSRMKLRMRKLIDALKRSSKVGGQLDVGSDDDMDYNVVKDYILLGSWIIRTFQCPDDPFSLRFEVDIKDEQGLLHRSAERHYWHKMAESFGDVDAAEKIRTAADLSSAENYVRKIKDFDETVWNSVKLNFWENAQKLKFEQIRWIRCLLIVTDKSYLAYSSQDRTFGTGWRKYRAEASQPAMWDGENCGGKILMKLRDVYKMTHVWTGTNEETETQSKMEQLRSTAWRRHSSTTGQMNNRGGGSGRRMGGGGDRSRFGRANGNEQRTFPSKSMGPSKNIDDF